jgi:hypothetical protein
VCFSLLHDAGVLNDALASYALIATVTDYDSWRLAGEVFKTLEANAETSRHVAATIPHRDQRVQLEPQHIRSQCDRA